VILDSPDLEYVSAALSRFEMLVLAKDQTLYSWIWKQDTKLKKYRKLDIPGISTISLRGSEAFLIKHIPMPQLTRIINYPREVYSTIPFFIILSLHDQLRPSYIPDADICICFSQNNNSSANEIEFHLETTNDDGDNTLLIVTVYATGLYWMHIYVEKQEIMSSPVSVSINTFPDHHAPIENIKDAINNKKKIRVNRKTLEKNKALEERQGKMEITRKRAQEVFKNYLDNKEADFIQREKQNQEKLKKKISGQSIP
jgi:hypothetical protein